MMLRNVIKWKSFKGTCIFQSKSFLTNSVVRTTNVSSVERLKLTSSQKKLLEFYLQHELPDKDLEKQLKDLKSKIIEKKELIKNLKTENAEKSQITQEVKALLIHKNTFADKIHEFLKPLEEFDMKPFEDIIKKHFFYDKAFNLYGGASGLFDLGPVGCAIQNNLLSEWRKFFVLGEQMHEIDCTILTSEIVLKASGHLAKFADIMVKDKITQEAFRVDHLLKAELEKMIRNNKSKDGSQLNEIKEILKKVENSHYMNDLEEIDKIISKFNIKSPSTGNELTSATQFNLMFQTQFGPSKEKRSFLRPETAQGIIANFERLLSFNQNKLPLAVAQVGKSFRNEINPKNGLIRQREFLMAEIEYFLDPNKKVHPKFADVENVEVCLYSAKNQENDESSQFIKIGDAVRDKMINNQALGYFIAKVHQFLLSSGVDKQKLRFRQHMPNEMAHYASDCWDAECLTSYGWIECVGCADRSSYDLIQHSKHSGHKLVADHVLPMPKSINVVEIQLNKEKLSKELLKDAKFINEYLRSLSNQEAENYEKEIINLSENEEIVLRIGEREFVIKASYFTLKRYEKKVYVEEIIPAIIEPSFGIGRIMYTLLEHNFKKRTDKKDTNFDKYFFSLPPKIAPYKCVVIPLGKNRTFEPLVKTLSNLLINAGISHKIDENMVSIGRRYLRNDELAIPFAITIDSDSFTEPNSVTLRNRDTKKQIRVNLSDLTNLLNDLIDSKVSWDELQSKFPDFKHESSAVED